MSNQTKNDFEIYKEHNPECFRVDTITDPKYLENRLWNAFYSGSNISVAEKLLPNIELVSAKVHEAWMDSKKAKGVTSRKSEAGEELMVPYDQLTEESKELDRASVKAVYQAIKSLTT